MRSRSRWRDSALGANASTRDLHAFVLGQLYRVDAVRGRRDWHRQAAEAESRGYCQRLRQAAVHHSLNPITQTSNLSPRFEGQGTRWRSVHTTVYYAVATAAKSRKGDSERRAVGSHQQGSRHYRLISIAALSSTNCDLHDLRGVFGHARSDLVCLIRAA